MSNLPEAVFQVLEKVRATTPLVHHITNMVVMNDTANITLHIGASPVMAHAKEEVAEMVGLAQALVLNIGTLTPQLVDAMVIAGRKANELSVPVIFDPVGVGATSLRTQSAKRILDEVEVAVIRGNSAELSILAGHDAVVRGVDAVGTAAPASDVAQAVAVKFGAIAAVTGQRDYVSDGSTVIEISNGHPLMAALTGTGCMATSVVAGFVAVEENHLLATAAALTCYGVAGEIAAEKSAGPGSFKTALFDVMYGLDFEAIKSKARVQVVAGDVSLV